MNKRNLLAFLASLIGCLVASHSIGETQPFDVRVSYVQDHAKHILRFSVTNVTTDRLILDASSLPWGNRYSAKILVVPMNGQPIREVYPIEDALIPTPVSLEPRTQLSGDVILGERFDLSTLWRDYARAVVFWYYRPTSVAGDSLGEYGGFVAITRE